MSSIIKNFAPSWPSVVMGTGIIPLALMLSREIIPLALPLALGFFALSTVLFVSILLMSLARMIFFPHDYAKDMGHPVSGAFVPTLPISAMVLAIDFLQVGPWAIGSAASEAIALWLFIIGTIGIYALGLHSAASMFSNGEIKASHATFGWFIPPVSQLIVPVVGLELCTIHPGSSAALPIFLISMMSLGIGSMLFIFVGANVYHRYLYHELPSSKMAPTVMIGLSPTAILVIIAVKLSAVAALPASPWPNNDFTSTAKVLSLVGWGFSAWWFILSAILLAKHLKSAMLDFALSWWALGFPVGALAVATGAMNKLFKLPVLSWTTAGLTSLLLAIWIFVLSGTIRIVANGSAFKKHE